MWGMPLEPQSSVLLHVMPALPRFCSSILPRPQLPPPHSQLAHPGGRFLRGQGWRRPAPLLHLCCYRPGAPALLPSSLPAFAPSPASRSARRRGLSLGHTLRSTAHRCSLDPPAPAGGGCTRRPPAGCDHLAGVVDEESNEWQQLCALHGRVRGRGGRAGGEGLRCLEVPCCRGLRCRAVPLPGAQAVGCRQLLIMAGAWPANSASGLMCGLLLGPSCRNASSPPHPTAAPPCRLAPPPSPPTGRAR